MDAQNAFSKFDIFVAHDTKMEAGVSLEPEKISFFNISPRSNDSVCRDHETDSSTEQDASFESFLLIARQCAYVKNDNKLSSLPPPETFQRAGIRVLNNTLNTSITFENARDNARRTRDNADISSPRQKEKIENWLHMFELLTVSTNNEK